MTKEGTRLDLVFFGDFLSAVPPLPSPREEEEEEAEVKASRGKEKDRVNGFTDDEEEAVEAELGAPILA